MGSTICLEHRDHQFDDLYDQNFGGKRQNNIKPLNVAFHIDDYFSKKRKRRKRKRKNKNLNK